MDRLLTNVMKSLTMTSVLGSASTTVLGIGVGAGDVAGRASGAEQAPGRWVDYFQYNMFLALMIAPVFQIVNIGTQLTEAFAGLDRTNEIMSELEENKSPERTVKMPPIQGRVRFEDVEFAYEADKPVLHGISFLAAAGNGDRAGGIVGIGQVNHHQPAVRLPHAGQGHACWWMILTLRTLT